MICVGCSEKSPLPLASCRSSCKAVCEFDVGGGTPLTVLGVSASKINCLYEFSNLPASAFKSRPLSDMSHALCFQKNKDGCRESGLLASCPSPSEPFVQELSRAPRTQYLSRSIAIVVGGASPYRWEGTATQGFGQSRLPEAPGTEEVMQ